MKVTIVVVTAGLALLAAGCKSSGAPSTDGQSASQQAANSADVYVTQNHVEQDNINLRQKVADDPTTILWCTFFPQNSQQQPFTVPIAGKLTSSDKRLLHSTYAQSGGSDVHPYWVDQAGQDGTYGSSVPYRYGFDPSRSVYSDFTDLPSMCTTAPTVFQKNETRVIVATDPALNAISDKAHQQLTSGDAAGAAKTLAGAETKS